MVLKHILFLAIIFFAAAIVNMLPWLLSGIPSSQQLSSDAEFHILHWYEYSKNYEGNFLPDKFFQYDERPAGDLFVDKIFVRITEFFGIDLPTGSIIVSVIALCSFLVAVYAVSYFALADAFLALIIGLSSVIPTFILTGSTYGFLSQGYLPRELALGFCLWILFLFLYAKKRNSRRLPFLVFLIIGLFANWYPVLFSHFAAVLILADIIQKRKLSKEHVLYGLIFAASAFFAIFDIVSKAKTTVAPDLAILHERFRYMHIFSFKYGVFHYLRRVILYAVWIPGIILFSKKFLKEKFKETKEAISFWLALWISAGIIMTIGVLLEQYTIYEKFLISRASLFFIFSSMIITVIILSPLFKKKGFLVLFLFCVFIGQSAIPTYYRSLNDAAKNAETEKSRLEALNVLSQHTTPQDVVLAETLHSNKIRAYAMRSVYSSWKDGGVTLLDGKKGREWNERILETNKIFQTNDLKNIIDFGRKNGATALFIETNKIKNSADIIKALPFYQAGDYTIILLD